MQRYSEYIPDDKKEAIINFKYNGRDDSIFYTKIAGHISQYCTDNFLPITMA